MLTASNLRTAAILAVTALLTIAAPANAAPTWLEPVSLTEPLDRDGTLVGQSLPSIAMSATGESVAVWSRRSDQNTYVLSASTRPPGGTWTSPQGITLTRTFHIADRERPALAIDDRGNAIAAYEYVAGDQKWVRAMFRPAGGEFQQPVTLSEPESTAFDLSPAIAMNARGDAVVIWERGNVIQATVRPAGGSFGAVKDLGSGVEHPAVAIADDGTAVAAWSHYNGLGFNAQAAVRPPGGAWGTPQDISVSDTGVEDVDVAVDPDGRATAVWSIRNGEAYRVEGASRGTTGAWTAAQQLSAPGVFARLPEVVVDRDNVAVAAWYRGSGTLGVLESATRPGGGPFSAPQPISVQGAYIDADQFDLAVDGTGGVIALWQQAPADVQAARRPPDGSFGAVVPVGAAAGRLTVAGIAADAAGNAVAAFRQGAALRDATSIQIAAFDFAPPDIDAVDVPATGTAGSPLVVSAAPKDVWSEMTTAWSFGDGGTATGTSARHVYTRPGTYTVSVTATDAVGNASSATRQVRIAAPPAPTPTSTPPPPPTPAQQPMLVRPAAGGIDRDGDGFLAGQDCNDDDVAIRPGATEVRGNRTDENCDGTAEPLPTLASGVVTRWTVHGRRVRLTALKVTQHFPRGWKARIKCRGKRCPFKSKRLKTKKVKRASANVIRSLRKRQRRFRAGQTVEVWVSAPGYNTKVARYRLRRGRIPSTRPLCVRPGEKRPHARCD